MRISTLPKRRRVQKIGDRTPHSTVRAFWTRAAFLMSFAPLFTRNTGSRGRSLANAQLGGRVGEPGRAASKFLFGWLADAAVI